MLIHDEAPGPAPFARLSDLHPLQNLLEEILKRPLSSHYYQLGAYENRVYQWQAEDRSWWIIKVYRPHKWSSAAILEEHAFLSELAELDLPVVLPYSAQGQSIWDFQEFKIGIFKKIAGRAFEDFEDGDFGRLGGLLARLHNCGRVQNFQERPFWKPSTQLEFYQNFWRAQMSKIPPSAQKPWLQNLTQISQAILQLEWPKDSAYLRIHGDLHRGNFWRDFDGHFHFLDFDDARQGLAIEDLWMLLPGPFEECQELWQELRAGYEVFAEFPQEHISLLPALRKLRYLNYQTWVALRYEDQLMKHWQDEFWSEKAWLEKCRDLGSRL